MVAIARGLEQKHEQEKLFDTINRVGMDLFLEPLSELSIPIERSAS